jgi:O-antigen/teichoic acid export membrane protein
MPPRARRPRAPETSRLERIVSDAWEPFGSEGVEPGLRRQVARGLTWTVVDTWGRQVINLAVYAVLARLLVPADFGVVALAAVFVALAQTLVDQGLGDALIQRREITRSHADTAFWVAVATGVTLTVAVVVLAGPIADLLNTPELQPILTALSASFVLAALSSIQIALLRRELAFRALAIRALLASLGGGAVGVALALLGYGAWALVGQLLASAAISVVALWGLTPWRPRFSASMQSFRELFPFGIRVVGADTLTFLSRNADSFLIGAVLGPTSLGFYAIGHRLLEVTQVLLVNVARKVTFPAFSRLQEDPPRMRRSYLSVTRISSALILPGYIAMAAVAPELVEVVFGGGWGPSAAVASVLFLIGPVLSVQAFSGSFLNAAGHPEVVLRFRLITTVANVIGFALAVPFGIVAVAAAFVIRGYLLLPLNLFWMRRYGGVAIGAFLAQVRGPAVATAFMVAAILAAKLASGGLTPPVLLAIEATAGAVAFVAALWVFDRRSLEELAALASQALRRGPPGGAAQLRDAGTVEE